MPLRKGSSTVQWEGRGCGVGWGRWKEGTSSLDSQFDWDEPSEWCDPHLPYLHAGCSECAVSLYFESAMQKTAVKEYQLWWWGWSFAITSLMPCSASSTGLRHVKKGEKSAIHLCK